MTQLSYLPFEKPIEEIALRILELETLDAAGKKDIPEKDIAQEIERLTIKKARVTRLIYRQLTPHNRVQIARHPQRPYARDYIATLMTEFTPLRGDRLFGDDNALITGLANYNNQAVAVLGVDKGRNTSERVAKNFGMIKPEGYRKAQRIMRLAEKFNLPVIAFVDTPGAYPGIEAEARGQGEAIAKTIETMLDVNIPVISIITGEGGSGGALALSSANSVLMLENSVYSVISPEGCASILWKDVGRQQVTAAAAELKLTAADLLKHGIIDKVIKEPVGGAHANPQEIITRVGKALDEQLNNLISTPQNYAAQRRKRFLDIGTFNVS